MTDVTRILSQIESGNVAVPKELLPLVYDELRRLAAQRIANEQHGQTLQATALVHDAYVRLVDVDAAQHWNSRRHFFGAAAEAMRRILIENARRKKQDKRGGDRRKVSLDDADLAIPESAVDLLALDEALDRLQQRDSVAAQLVKLRYFAGLTMPQAAEALGISQRSAERNWTYAKTWLHSALAESDTQGST